MFARLFDPCQDDLRHNETMSDWVPLEDASRRYGISRATLYRLIAEGRVKRGKRVGDRRSYVSSADVKGLTSIRAVGPTVRPTPASRRRPRRGR